MKNSEFSDEQITFALEQAGKGTTVAGVCRKMDISIEQAKVAHGRYTW